MKLMLAAGPDPKDAMPWLPNEVSIAPGWPAEARATAARAPAASATSPAIRPARLGGLLQRFTIASPLALERDPSRRKPRAGRFLTPPRVAAEGSPAHADAPAETSPWSVRARIISGRSVSPLRSSDAGPP